jgi:hypothetical protein
MIIPLPIISSASDYESFLEIMGSNLPYTYDEWLKFPPKWREQHTLYGDQTIDVYVDPDKFIRFLGRTGRAPNLNSLSMFAQAVHKGETY